MCSIPKNKTKKTFKLRKIIFVCNFSFFLTSMPYNILSSLKKGDRLSKQFNNGIFTTYSSVIDCQNVKNKVILIVKNFSNGCQGARGFFSA